MAECEKILQELESEDNEVIREAAFAAGEHRCREAIPLLAKHLHSQNLGVQEAADLALRRIGGPETVEAVIPLLHSEDAPVRNLSMDILRQVGGEDLQSLLKLMHDEDADIRIFGADILGSTDNVLAVGPLCDALLKDPEVNVRYQAAVSLGNLAFKDAAPCLNKAMADEEWVQFAVIESLTKIRDESSVTALVKALDTSTELVASMIIEALGEMANIKAVPILLKRLETSATALRNKIVKAIVSIMGGKSLTLLSDQQREKFRQYLLVALQDEDEDIQDAAMHGLAFVGGAPASKAILKLASGMNPDTEHDRLERAVDCLASIGMNDSVETVLRQGEQLQVLVALEAITRMESSRAAPMLMEIFWEKDRDTQREIAKALANKPGDEVKPFFMDVLDRHADGNVLKTAMFVLGQELHAAESGDKIFELLQHQFDDVKESALEACVAIGGPEMERRFAELFHSEEPLDRMMATHALGKLGVAEHMGQLKQALEDEIPDIRKVALEALGDACLNDEDLDLAVSRLDDEHKEVRLTVVELLGKCGEDKVFPHLVRALADEDDWVRIRAVEALGELRKPEAIAELVPLLEHPNKLVPLKVVEALGEIGGHAAFRSLLEVVNGDDPELQSAAEEAIARLQEQGDVA
jgi:HEAT repeat protein